MDYGAGPRADTVPEIARSRHFQCVARHRAMAAAPMLTTSGGVSPKGEFHDPLGTAGNSRRPCYHTAMAQQPPAGCFGFLLGLLGLRRKSAPAGAGMPEVRVSTKFVSGAEADFFRVLRAVVGDRGHVLAQVSLGRLLYFPGTNATNPGRARWWNKVCQRSVDFLVCDPATLKPLVAIELDEPSHARPERQTRDQEVDAVLEAAGLVLLRVLTGRTYDTRKLSDIVLRHLPPERHPPVTVTVTEDQ